MADQHRVLFTFGDTSRCRDAVPSMRLLRDRSCECTMGSSPSSPGAGAHAVATTSATAGAAAGCPVETGVSTPGTADVTCVQPRASVADAGGLVAETPGAQGVDRVQLGRGSRPGWLLYGLFGGGAAVLGVSTWYGVQLSRRPRALPPHLQAVAQAGSGVPAAASADVVGSAGASATRGVDLHPAFQRVPGTQQSIGGLAVSGAPCACTAVCRAHVGSRVACCRLVRLSTGVF